MKLLILAQDIQVTIEQISKKLSNYFRGKQVPLIMVMKRFHTYYINEHLL